MSKLLQKLEVRKTYNKVDIFDRMVAVTKETASLSFTNAIEYRIMVTIGSMVVVSEQQSEELDIAIRNVKRNIVEAVYGEFRENIAQLRLALYSRDTFKAIEVLDTLVNEMYGIGE